jgi:hypothetical protein
MLVNGVPWPKMEVSTCKYSVPDSERVEWQTISIGLKRWLPANVDWNRRRPHTRAGSTEDSAAFDG